MATARVGSAQSGGLPSVYRPARSRVRDALTIARYLGQRIWYHVRRTPGLAVLSLVIGIMLWLLVTDSENPTRTDVFPGSIPVEAANVGEDQAVANVLPAVQIRVSAPENRWEQLTAANFRAFVDLNGLSAREQHVPVNVDVVGVSRVRVLDVSPSTVLVNLEQVVTKQVPVAIAVAGAVPRGYGVKSATPDRQMVDVSGPQSLVALVQQAGADVNVTGLTVGIQQTVSLTARGEAGGEIRGVHLKPDTTRVTLTIEQTALTRTLPLEPDLTGQPAPGYRITGVKVTPPTVSVEGTLDVLQVFDTLRLPKVSVDGARSDIKTTVRIPLPEGVVGNDQQVAVVEVNVAPVPGSLVMNLAPEVLNVRSGLTARISPGSIAVTLDGPLPLLNALTPGAVRATVDAGPLGPGRADVRVDVRAPEGVAVRDVQPPAVSVTLTGP